MYLQILIILRVPQGRPIAFPANRFAGTSRKEKRSSPAAFLQAHSSQRTLCLPGRMVTVIMVMVLVMVIMVVIMMVVRMMVIMMTEYLPGRMIVSAEQSHRFKLIIAIQRKVNT